MSTKIKKQVKMICTVFMLLLAGAMALSAAVPVQEASAEQDGNGQDTPLGQASFAEQRHAYPFPTFEFVTESPTPVRTSTPVPDKPIAQPTVESSATPVASNRPASADTIAGVPVCSTHNPTLYHSLVEYRADGSILCTYGHEHKDDPNSVNDLLGPPGAWFGGQELSYPWQTPYENEKKHNAYAWLVRRDLKPLSLSDNYFQAFRIQGHFLGSGGLLPNGERGGFQSENHSFSMEVIVCPKSAPYNCGIARVGGWQDYGKAVVDGECILPDSDPAIGCNTSLRRIHGSANAGRRDFTWYGQNNRYHGIKGVPAISAGVGIIGDAWAPINRADLDELNFYPPNLKQRAIRNGSWIDPHLMTLAIPEELDPDGDGRVTTRGYTDRWGNIRTDRTCLTLRIDCVPFELLNAPVGVVQFRSDTYLNEHGIDFRYDDHDVQVEHQGELKSLIRYPN